MSKEQTFRNYNLEEQLQRAKWFKEDLDSDGGWIKIHEGPDVTYWKKTFPDAEVPVKILISHVMPMSVKKYSQLFDPVNMEFRKKWDNTFSVMDVLETYPNGGGYVIYGLKKMFWPMSDRDFVAFNQLHREIDWYGKKATLIGFKNAWHPSKPENVDGIVREPNGGDFYIVTPDDNEPETACKVFGLSSYNLQEGQITNFIVRHFVPQSFNKLRQNVIKGFKKYGDDLK